MHKLLILLVVGSMLLTRCSVPAIIEAKSNSHVPVNFSNSTDTTSSATISWRQFFSDKNLVSLIDTALHNNQELMKTLQEIEIARNDVRVRRSFLTPSVNLGGGIGVDKVGRYTSQGAGDASTEIKPGIAVPDALMNYQIAASANWEVDIWRKLRNSRDAAIARYLSTVDGKNFVITNLIAEVATTYYELIALDNQLSIVKQTIELQNNALNIVKIQKEAARTTELAVQKFEAEVYKSRSLEFDLLRQTTDAENRLNLLLARYPASIIRDDGVLMATMPPFVETGVSSQLLANRPDIRQAELELTASKLDVRVARAEFFPSFGISAAVGFAAFNPSYLIKAPESLLYSLAGDLAGPLINRHAIKAEFASANARQLQALYEYDRTVLNAYLEVATQLSNIKNLGSSYDLKSQQVNALTKSIDFANELFKSARVDYFEVLMTQRDALESKLELIDTRKAQFIAAVNIYAQLGGGWQ